MVRPDSPIQVKLKAEGCEDVSGLVMAPIGMSEEDMVTSVCANHRRAVGAFQGPLKGKKAFLIKFKGIFKGFLGVRKVMSGPWVTQTAIIAIPEIVFHFVGFS